MKIDLRARAIADTTLAGLVGKKIDWTKSPQGTPEPRIVLYLITEDRPQHMKGFIGLRQARVQASIFTRTAAELGPIQEALIACLIPAATQGSTIFQRAFIGSIADISSQGDTQFTHGTAVDFLLNYTAA